MAKRISDRFVLVEGTSRPGGLSEVRKAFDKLQPGGGFAAIKVLHQRDNGEVIKVFLERETEALRALQHPNIIRMLDWGWDEELQRYFIALEWVDRSLKDEISTGKAVDWTSFFQRIGKPLASALAFAHLREIEHRDIKPGNVLIAQDGTLKLADFGIAKIRSKVEVVEETLAGYRSDLYAPPEREDTIPFVRDVFSYGVLAVQVLTGGRARDYPDLAPAIEGLDIPPEFRAVLRDCVSLEPAKRPANGAVLEQQLATAERVSGDRASRRSNAFWLKITRRAAEQVLLVENGVQVDWKKAESAILADLGGQVHADYAYNKQANEVDQKTICLAGNSLFLRLKPDEESADRAVIVRAERWTDERLARWREHALPVGPTLTWTFSDPGDVAAFEGMELLIARLQEHGSRQQEDAQVSGGEQAGSLFEGWRRLLDAREEASAGGRQPLDYYSVGGSGRELVFHLAQSLGSSVVGDEWSVTEYAQARPVDRGEVISQDDDKVVLRFRRRGISVPQRGVLLPYLGPSQVALNRQRDALSNVSMGQSTNPLLRSIIENPSSVRVGKPADITRWFRADLDDSKRQVVRHALGSQDLALVEGPPGTGKTTVIAEIVEQILSRSPKARILIVSQTHIAIDNALHRIEEAGVRGVVRLGRPDDPRVAQPVQHLLLDRQLKRWAKGVREQAEAHLEALAAQRGMEARHVKAALLLEELATVAANLDYVAQQLAALTRAPVEERTTSAREAGERAVDARHRLDELKEQRLDLYNRAQRVLAGDLTIREDLSVADARAAVEALLGNEAAGRKMMQLVKLQGEWLQRIETDQKLVTAFLRTCQVVGGTALGFLGHPAARDLDFDLCIFDEASKATATEALVPLARARQWILVGDTRQLPPIDEDILRNAQLMADHQLTPDIVQTTLFQHLISHTEPPVRHMLREQYRMTPPIGNLISTCFYKGELHSPGAQGLPGYSDLYKPVLWWNTANLGKQRRETERSASETSVSNRTEAQLAARWLHALDRAVELQVVKAPADRKLEVLVIAPYALQLEELNRRLAGSRFTRLSCEVLSVDAVQGRESDIAVFSVTRSNDHGQFGFLGQSYWRRINVALSRARFGLTIIGDASFCSSKPGALRDVLDYISNHQEGCEIRDAVL